MSGFDLSRIASRVAREGCVVRVLVTSVKGSAPREPGASMLVWDGGQDGTIGGGALEWEAMHIAGEMLGQDGHWLRRVLSLPLGPRLGQCCGGAVELLLERFGHDELSELRVPTGPALVRPLASGQASSARTHLPHAVRRQVKSNTPATITAWRAGDDAGPALVCNSWIAEPMKPPSPMLFLYGAGHVGRAIVNVLEGLSLEIIWVDDHRQRFPKIVPDHANMLVSDPLCSAVDLAPADTAHLVLTYSHVADLEICHRVLSRPFRSLGLIGSATKRARFRSRLSELGHSETQISRMACPIGNPSLGKHPSAIAIGVAAELIEQIETLHDLREVYA